MLAEDRDRGDGADAVVRHQRSAAGLLASVVKQLSLDRLQLVVDALDHVQGEVDRLATAGLSSTLASHSRRSPVRR